MKIKILSFLGVLLGLLIINYFILLPLNFRYSTFTTIILILIFVFYLLFIRKNKEKPYIKIGKNLIAPFNNNFYLELIFVFIILLIPTLYSIFSSPFFFSHSYQKLIGNVEEKEFTNDFSAIETNQLPVIDKSLASLLGDKKLGYERGLGSEFHVGLFNDISIKGKLVAVAPLEYNGFFKWLNNEGTPGFIVVDKVTGEVSLINELKGQPIHLRYLPSAFFSQDLMRHVYFNNNMDNQLYSYTFEVDDDMNPYWVINKTHKTIGISGGEDIKSIITVNAITGTVKEYSIKDAPNWVDTVYPDSLVMKQLDDWGLYIHGFFNTMFSEKDVVRITSSSRRVYNGDNVFHYTGLTSSGSDNATIGFAFVNARTKATTLYKISGATEEAAMRSAEGKVQNLRYRATFPLPINVNNVPTFFLTLKDDSNLIKQYAFVNIEYFAIVGSGETIEQAKNNYLRLLSEENVYKDDKEKENIAGNVSRIGFSISNGETTYYLTIEGNKKIYYLSSNISNEINITKVGDKVTLEVSKNKVTAFANNTLME